MKLWQKTPQTQQTGTNHKIDLNPILVLKWVWSSSSGSSKGGSNSVPKPVRPPVIIYLLSMTCNQIWLIRLVDDCQCGLHHKIW
jgi:hypothetical protein